MEFVGRNQYSIFGDVIRAFRERGVKRPSRNGDVLQLPGVVTIVQEKPWERVFMHPVRDSNPFFHLIEGLAMLADFNSAPLLTYLARNMKNFSDDGLTYNAFYGTRAKTTFGMDQFAEVINILLEDPGSRQAVVQLWNPTDLLKQTKDKACNMSLVFSVDFKGRVVMTSFNRSNDAIWGYFGANAVHLSMFHEYVAENVRRFMGPWTHVSNNFHGYLGNKKFVQLLEDESVTENIYDPYPDGSVAWMSLFSAKPGFIKEVRKFLVECEAVCLNPEMSIANWHISAPQDHVFLSEIAHPMIKAIWSFKSGLNGTVSNEAFYDWLTGGRYWLADHKPPLRKVAKKPATQQKGSA